MKKIGKVGEFILAGLFVLFLLAVGFFVGFLEGGIAAKKYYTERNQNYIICKESWGGSPEDVGHCVYRLEEYDIAEKIRLGEEFKID
jgi:hypothetical protein